MAARDPETGGADSPSHATTNNVDSAPYADTNRFGRTQTGDTTPIKGPRNHITDDVWGANDTAGGSNAPDAPGIVVVSR